MRKGKRLGSYGDSDASFEGWAFIILTLLLALGFYYIGWMHGVRSDGVNKNCTFEMK